MNNTTGENQEGMFTKKPYIIYSGQVVAGVKIKISLLFHILKRVKSLPFYIPEAWKRYPFQAEPPHVGHKREYPPSDIVQAKRYALVKAAKAHIIFYFML